MWWRGVNLSIATDIVNSLAKSCLIVVAETINPSYIHIMKLLDYLEQPGVAKGKLAIAVGVTPSMMRQWAIGYRDVIPARAAAIERETRQQVMRWDLRPNDWWLIWPELKRKKGAPPISSTATNLMR